MLKNKFLLTYLFIYSTLVFGQDTLKTVKIDVKQKGLKKPIHLVSNTTVMTNKELLKAACCNLSESFETNPSIDVNFSDALTGTKQIKMLGLTSPYLLITEENIPSVRGASQAYGLSFTPGTWVESIQITKGAGSVVNGFESISGQINTELIKPMSNPPFFLNLYISSDSRTEINTHFSTKITDKWASSLLIHGNERFIKTDMNKDGFLDNPLSKQLNVLNRWQYRNAEKGWVSFINLHYMNDKKQSGQTDFDPQKDAFSTTLWGSQIKTERMNVATKIGYVFPDMPFQSIGFQNAFSSHNQDSYFGLNQYAINQKSVYSNLIFNSIINNTMHKFTTGLNFAFDAYNENIKVPSLQNQFKRIDTSVGAFFEYNYDNLNNFSCIAGGRIDNHNQLGTFLTPRLHLRYNPWEKGIIRASIGRGKRIANIFAENQPLLASNRNFLIQGTSTTLYGLNPEIAWNYGVSFSQSFTVLAKAADIGIDFYRTDFQKQVIVDEYQNSFSVLFYNLNGTSFANSLQLDFNIEIIKHLEVRTAYKFYDIRTDYKSGQSQRPFQAQNCFFTNLSYETAKVKNGSQWKFDATFNWIDKQKLPNTSSNTVDNQLPPFSPSYILLNAQLSKVFSPTFETYFGGENLGNYTQKRPIVGVDNPFGTTFDTSMVYAPIFGSMYYLGLRYKVK